MAGTGSTGSDCSVLPGVARRMVAHASEGGPWRGQVASGNIKISQGRPPEPTAPAAPAADCYLIGARPEPTARMVTGTPGNVPCAGAFCTDA